MSQADGATAGRHSRWVEMWREAVCASAAGMMLVDLTAGRFLELSPRAAELLGRPRDSVAGLDYLAAVDDARRAAETFRLVADGVIDGLSARRRFLRADSSWVEVQVTGWAIRATAGGPHLGLCLAGEPISDEAAAASAEEVVADPASPDDAVPADGTRITLDDRWRIAGVEPSAPLLGEAPAQALGRSVLDLTHADDLPALLFAFARATTYGKAGARVRLRHGHARWRSMRLTPAVLDRDRGLPFTVVVAPARDEHGTGMADPVVQVSGLAADLRRIATRIEVAGMLGQLLELTGSPRLTAAGELSPRQREIVARLVRGERVRSIAMAMHLSPSTVRNHLSVTFDKVGVRSQEELVALWRSAASRALRTPGTAATPYEEQAS